MKSSTIFIIFFSLILISGVGLFYYEHNLPDAELIDSEVNQRLLRIDSLNSSVSELALRSRINIDTNYDLLARTSSLLDKEVQMLEEAYFSSFSLEGTLLEKRFVAFKDLLATKKELVENFKSHNSVLRNSEKYAPIVGQELMTVAENSGFADVAKLYGETTLKALEYARQGEMLDAELLRVLLSKIPETESKMPREELSRIIEFTNHISTLIEEKEETDIYLRQALTSTSGTQREELFNAWKEWLAGQNQSREDFMIIVQVYVLLLMFFTIFTALRLRALYVSLDEQVAQRTAEVKIAYEELNQSEKRLMQSEKMASLGQLVAGVAHEVNTPLGYIKGNIETVRTYMKELQVLVESSKIMSGLISKKPLDKKRLSLLIKKNVVDYRNIEKRETVDGIGELLKDASYGLKQISQLVSSLKKFSHPSDENTARVDVHAELNATLSICSTVIGDRELVKNYADDLPEIEGRAGQLTQVFMNVLTNAVQASDEEGGMIAIETQDTDNGIQIIFEDNGQGMNKETSDRIFDPFFTTKGVNEGIGLGMSISYKIIESHGGSILVESTPKRGTKIVVKLPHAMDE